MGVALAAFVLGMIMVGFTMLMALPLLFVWLMVGVYTEPWETQAAGPPAEEALEPEELDAPKPKPEAEPERPRVMVAGRRRPL